MFNPFTGASRAIKRLFRKSVGERKLLTMLNNGSTPIQNQMWWNNRSEYPLHYQGWNFVAISAIATELAGMVPQYAYKREDPTPETLKKCLTDAQYKKALTGLQAKVALEPLPMDHRLWRLHHRPNPVDVAWTFWYKVSMFLSLTGEAYIWDVPDRGYGLPTESWVMPSHWMWPIPGKNALIDEYEVRPVTVPWPDEAGGTWMWFGGGSGKFKIPADQIVPFFNPSPHTMVGGYASLQAGATWTDCSDNIDRSRTFKFQNDAFPGVAIEFDKDMEIDDIAPAEIERLKMMIKEKYGSVKRTGEPVVLGPGMKMVLMQTSPRDMDYVQGFDQLRDTIMALHRTSPVVVGMGKETTYAAARAGRASWHNSTINPLATMFGQVMTEHRCRKFDDDLICFWPNSAPDDLEFEHKQRTDLLDRNVLWINEARAQVGLPPIDGGDCTLAEFLAENAVPKMLDDGQGSILAPDRDGAPDRQGTIFAPGGRHGMGHEPMLPNGKSLTDLSRRLLLAPPSRNGHHLEEVV